MGRIRCGTIALASLGDAGDVSKTAAEMIMRTCREKYPHPGPAWVDRLSEMTQVQLLNLTGTGGPDTLKSRFSATLYNGNNDFTVYEIEIVLSTDGSSRTYRTTARLEPLSSGTVTFTTLKADFGPGYGWQILSAKGLAQ